MVETFFVKVNNYLEQNIFEKLQTFISDERRNRIKKFKFYEDALLSLFSELMVRMILTKTKNIPNSEIQFSNNIYGKPFLRDKSLDFHFNISHARGIVLCAVADKPVGVDVEYKKSIEMDIAKRFFTKEEYNRLMSLKEKEQIDLFYDLWVVKESYLKFTGFGLQKGLDSFVIDFDKGQIISEDGNPMCFLRQYNFFHEYPLAVCSKKNEFGPNLIEISQQQLIDFLQINSKSYNSYL